MRGVHTSFKTASLPSLVSPTAAPGGKVKVNEAVTESPRLVVPGMRSHSPPGSVSLGRLAPAPLLGLQRPLQELGKNWLQVTRTKPDSIQVEEGHLPQPWESP